MVSNFSFGIVQLGIGGMVVITINVNRVMVVELLLPAAVPGLLVMAHYLVQLLRPRMDMGLIKAEKPLLDNGRAFDFGHREYCVELFYNPNVRK